MKTNVIKTLIFLLLLIVAMVLNKAYPYNYLVYGMFMIASVGTLYYSSQVLPVLFKKLSHK